MANTHRRAFLGAIVVAPLAGASAALAASSSRAANLADLGTEELLRHAATTSKDSAFAALCATALAASVREIEAWDWCREAIDAAEALTPAYPAGLCYMGQYTSRRGGEVGSVVETDERCVPPEGAASMGIFWNLTHWRATAVGITNCEAEAQLRAEYADWKAAKDAADERFQTKELEAAAEAASDASGDALDAVLEHPARDAHTLLTKLWLRADSGDHAFDHETWDALVHDVARVVARRA